MNEMQVFNFNQQQVRTVIKDGELWWIVKDICDILGLTNPTEVCKRVDDEDKYTLSITEGGSIGNSQFNIVNESGLYNIIFQSRKKEAKDFKHWVTSEVLPSIRKTGSFSIHTNQIDSNFLYQMAEAMKAKEKEIQLLKTKAEFFDAVSSSKTAIQIGDVAKILGISGIGRNNLFQILRDQKVLMKDNMPYQTFCDKGYFRVIEQTYTTPEGEKRISFKTLVYQTGVDFIRKLLKSRENCLKEG